MLSPLSLHQSQAPKAEMAVASPLTPEQRTQHPVSSSVLDSLEQEVPNVAVREALWFSLSLWAHSKSIL